MIKIDDLILKLCPDGVEFKKLGNVVNILDHLRRPVTKSARKIGNIPYYGANGIQDFVEEYIFDGTYLLVGEDGSVINKDGSPILNWATGKIWVNNHAHVLSEDLDTALLRYVFFYLQTIDVTKLVRGTPPKLNQQHLRNISIPIPPFPIQREIVNILDKFTTLEADLEAELEAELEARKKQYEHYRNKLLTPLEIDGMWYMNDMITKWIGLEEMFAVSRGRVMSKDYLLQNAGKYSVYSSQTESNGEIGKIDSYDYDGEYLTWTTDGANAGTIFYRNGKFSITNVCGLLRMKTNEVAIKYVFYVLGIIMKSHVSSGMGNPKLMSNVVRKISIPVPPLHEQERIVSILDKFDVLVNNILEGLPAEIQARRQQYEHYRAKLLSFNSIKDVSGADDEL